MAADTDYIYGITVTFFLILLFWLFIMLLLMTLWIPFDTGVPDIVNDAVQVGLVKLILM